MASNSDLLESLIDQGFTVSYLTDEDSIRVKCEQCQATVINGMACHETGCPIERELRTEGFDDE